jgi:hypothetical protein
MSIKIYIFIISSLMLKMLFAQPNIYEVENNIKVELSSNYVNCSRVGALESVNEELNTYRDFKFPITDPYGSLIDCYIFQADVDNGGLVGIYKNGNILWDSGPIIEFGEYADILGTMDLNNNGNVEVLFGIYYGMHNSYQSIWIFSWDGQIGSLLNETNSVNYLNKSVIFSFEWYTEIYDVDGDGILEIKGQDEETRSAKIYSWNGIRYGDYGMQIPPYAPKNLLTAKVSCGVTSSQYRFLFNYTVKNDSTSKQSIELFAVEKPFEFAYAGSTGPNNKWNAYSSNNWNLFVWDVNIDLQKFPFDYLSPGEVKSNYRLESATPTIFIGNYYVQGKNGDSFPDDKYIFENSFKGVTICGTNPPDPFSPLDFLDILLNYNQRSLELGWITNQQTADKYESLFTSAKTQLQQNNNNTVRATLQTVLQEVDIDSTDNLTSEAYALLRYNTEYLLTKIQAFLDISVITPAMSLVKPGAFTMEVKGSGFTSSSVVYFNGNARATAYLSDSILTAQILASDVTAKGRFAVWVRDGSKDTDTVMFTVVDKLANKVTPIFNCVKNNGDGTYTAYFGYNNLNSVSVYIPIGKKNKFDPKPEDRGQTRVFLTGVQERAVTINFNGKKLSWTIDGSIASGDRNSGSCP